MFRAIFKDRDGFTITSSYDENSGIKYFEEACVLKCVLWGKLFTDDGKLISEYRDRTQTIKEVAKPELPKPSVRLLLNGSQLKELIGGDTKIEAELRSSIVQEFAKKHLKAIANDDVFKKIKQSLLVDFKTELKNFLISKEATAPNSWSYRDVISKEILEDIKARLKEEFIGDMTKDIRVSLEIEAKEALLAIKKKRDYLIEEIGKVIDKLEGEAIKSQIENRVQKKLSNIIKGLSEGGVEPKHENSSS